MTDTQLTMKVFTRHSISKAGEARRYSCEATMSPASSGPLRDVLTAPEDGTGGFRYIDGTVAAGADRQPENKSEILAMTKPTLPAEISGTEITRFNALKHGVLSRYTMLPWEDADEYQVLVAALVAEHAPQGPTEEHLVEELAGIFRGVRPRHRCHSRYRCQNEGRHRRYGSRRGDNTPCRRVA
jgi:hypothetical protein